MTYARFLASAAAAFLLAASPAFAVDGRPQPPRPAASPAAPGAVTGRERLPPAPTVQRVPRSFAFCTQEARRRGYRGAERRHFVQRCRLGYGVRLFPRRPPTAVPAPRG